MGKPVSGVFRHWRTQINFSPDHVSTASIVTEIDLSSVKLENPMQAAALVSRAWFDVDRYPAARFIAPDVRMLSGGGYLARGQLQLKGVTRPVDLRFDWRDDGESAHLSGKATVNRTWFRVGDGDWLTDSQVAFDVDVSVDAHLRAPEL